MRPVVTVLLVVMFLAVSLFAADVVLKLQRGEPTTGRADRASGGRRRSVRRDRSRPDAASR